MSLRRDLEEKNNFTVTEKELADYILKNKETVLTSSIQQLAANTYSSTASIIRLCRKLGTDGFSNFKIRLAAELQKSEEGVSVDPDFPFSKQDSFFELSRNLFTLQKEALEETYNLLSVSEYKKAIHFLKKANRCAVFGLGDSYIRGLDFQNKMMKIGYPILSSSTEGELVYLAGLLKKDDCALFISYGGASKELAKPLQIAFENGANIILITSNLESSFVKKAHAILQVGNSEASKFKYSTFASQEGASYILDLLFSFYFIRDFDAHSTKRMNIENRILNTKKF